MREKPTSLHIAKDVLMRGTIGRMPYQWYFDTFRRDHTRLCRTDTAAYERREAHAYMQGYLDHFEREHIIFCYSYQPFGTERLSSKEADSRLPDAKTRYFSATHCGFVYATDRSREWTQWIPIDNNPKSNEEDK